MHAPTPPPNNDTTPTVQLGELPMMAFAWRPCPRHRWFGPAGAIVSPDSPPWCPGDGATLGHWLDEQGAAR